MFEREIAISGRHADELKFLAKNAEIFSRYMDVYLKGIIIGLFYNKKEKNDISIDSTAKIFADTVIKEKKQLTFLYRLVMLLDETCELTNEEKIDRAFRDDAISNNQEKMKENLDLFNEYANGGIHLLYEQFFKGNTDIYDYINEAYKLVTSFKDMSSELIEKQINIIIEQ